MNRPDSRNTLLYLIIGIAIVLLLVFASNNRESQKALSFTDLIERIKSGDVTHVKVSGDELEIAFSDNSTGISRKSPESTAQEQLLQLGVTTAELGKIEWEFEEVQEFGGGGFNLLATLLPILLIGGLIFFLMRQSQGANNQAMSFGKSRARLFNADSPKVKFEDVAGVEEAKAELQEVVEFLRQPEKFLQLGARIPKGVLLVGRPGTGKTLLAKAVAGEAGVPFFSISGSEFVEMFVGVGASRVRDLFDQAKRNSPCIIFIDEIDAVGRHRGAGLGGSHDEREQTLNQILVEMDGFDTDTNVIVLAATNRPDILDPALLRPGRFDRQVIIDQPDVKGREAILRVHLRGKPVAADVDVAALARATPGFVGADIENMVNEAALLAARKNKKTIGLQDLQAAIERVILGPERKSRVISEEERRITAYHEAGHAVLGHLLPYGDPVRKVTIIPRGMSGGSTLFLPEEDVWYTSRSRLLDQIVIALGGRAAEEIVFNEITTGAASDLERVTKLARAMVTRFGMSDKLGPMMFGQKEEMVFLGREIGEQRDYSEAVAEEIDTEVRRIVGEAYHKAREILKENRHLLEAVAQRLLEVETLEEEEFLAIVTGEVKTPNITSANITTATESEETTPQEEADGDNPTLGTAPSPA